jgi:predicted AAA+ superfamily ATPase
MIYREATEKLKQLSSQFKAVAIIGPRQSGKTTLVRAVFSGKPYVSLENPDNRNYALQDPRGFLGNYPDGAILDEVQRTPDLFSYLQGILDEKNEPGLFILTGSNNFLLQQNITQSLAGRIAYLELLPFSLLELSHDNILASDHLDELMLRGFYPPLHVGNILPEDWYANYLRTYIERDVRQIKNVTDLIIFERFMRLLAGRTGQEINFTALAVEAGTDVKTVQSWVGVLESSFIIYLLRPLYKNYNKTLTKRPKVYFHDTGLACSLMGITTPQQLNIHPLRGSIFETFIVSELVKKRTNAGKRINLFYWRDKTGYEIDVIIDNALSLLPVEIKSGKTITSEFFRNMLYWLKLSGEKSGYVLYAGDQEQKRSTGITVAGWERLRERDFLSE